MRPNSGTLLSIIPLFLLPTLIQSQTCENYGIPFSNNNGSCICPPGFGGPTCSYPGCGGNIFQGSQRGLSIPSSSNSNNIFANLTQSNCVCENGWTGTGCNVCQSSQACQSAFASSPFFNSSSLLSSASSSDGQNDTLVCNTSPRIYAAGDLSCTVNNPTINSVFQGLTTLTALRTLAPSLTPLPNITGFGINTTTANMFVQMWYNGVEQFYCDSQECAQDLNATDTNGNGVDWNCEDLRCTCRSGTEFCGGNSFLDLTQTINNLTGTVSISCSQSSSNSSSNVTCTFIQQTITSLLSSSGLVLSDCVFGECLTQSVLSSQSSSSSSPSSAPLTSGGEELSGGVIAGLAVVGFLLALAAAVVGWGVWAQKRARVRKLDMGHRAVLGGGGGGGVGGGNGFAAGGGALGAGAAREGGPAGSASGIRISWKNVSYIIPQRHSGSFFHLGSNRRRRPAGTGAGTHTYRDSESGFKDKDGDPDETIHNYENEKLGKYDGNLDTTDLDADGGIVILNNISGEVLPGEVCAVLGPSGAGKTSLITLLASAASSANTNGNQAPPEIGHVFGDISFSPYPSPSFSASNSNPMPNPRERAIRASYLPQSTPLPALLTVRETLLFAARLRLPEYVSDEEKVRRVDEVIELVGLGGVAGRRIGTDKAGEKRGLSGGEMRRVSLALEILAPVDVLFLDEVTSGLDSTSALKISKILHDIAHDPIHPVAVVMSVHQPSSALYHTFDKVLLLSHGKGMYFGRGGMEPVRFFEGGPGASGGISATTSSPIHARSQMQMKQLEGGHNVADYLLDIASEYTPMSVVGVGVGVPLAGNGIGEISSSPESSNERVYSSLDESARESGNGRENLRRGNDTKLKSKANTTKSQSQTKSNWATFASLKTVFRERTTTYPTTFLTQFEVLAWREWKILCRDKLSFITHVAVACVLGVFCGGLYFQTNDTIAGFQSRVGCLFFLGALIAFSSLSALYNLVEVRPLFVRERAGGYYSPTAWLLSRLVFDVVPLRIIPTLIVSSITYWMAGMAHNATEFFKFLFILVLYTLVMTLWNFFLACLITNGSISILLSALSALYQMTYAGFFVNLGDIPPVLRWLQWLCPLKYTLEALSVNEVNSGLMIQDTLDGVPVDISATLIMETLFGFGLDNYYRDVLVLFAYIAGFGIAVIATVWVNVRERR